MNIIPKVAILKSIRADRGDLLRLCGEAVDNSLDANATAIDIHVGDKEIRFQDNGIGVTPDGFEALFTLGDHRAMASTRLGRFGIGIKEQAVNCADVIEVRTISVAGRYFARVNWRDVLRKGEWEIDDPVRLPTLVGAPTGTTITLSMVRALRRVTLDKISEQLSERFYPALAEGRSITLNGSAVALLADPAMTDIIDRSLELSDGRKARVRAGILASPSRLNRVHVSYGHRVIMPASTLGCGRHVGLSNMFARVHLSGGPWHLGKFKDDLTDELEREELEEAVEAVLRPILEKCGSAAISAKVALIGQLVNDLLPDEIAAARPRRQIEKKRVPGPKLKNKRQPGTVDPEKSDLADGPAKTKRPPRDQLLITFEAKDAEHGIGHFEPGRPNRVNLSPDNWHIAQLVQQRDDRATALAVLVIAMQIFEHGRDQTRKQGELDFLGFGLRVAAHLNASRNGEATTAAASI